jgi:PAS domain S-box-containing protein
MPSSAAPLAERLVEASPDSLIAVSAGGEVLFWNAGAEALFGYAREQAIGRPLENLIGVPGGEGDVWTTAGPPEAPIPALHEVTLRRRDGTLVVAAASVRAVRNQDGTVEFVAVSLRDVTERRRLEDALRRRSQELEEQNRRMREASRLKSEFLASMSHELRTPLNAIIGFSQVMRDGKVGPVSDEHKAFLGDIYTSGLRLLQLIDDVLDSGAVEVSRHEIPPEPIPGARSTRGGGTT